MLEPIQVLKLNPIFAALPAGELERVALFCRARALQAGEVLFELGDEGEEVYIVQDGKIAIYIPTASQPQAGPALREFTPGELFGEMAILERQPRSTSARAETPSTVLGLDKQHFQALIDTHPDFSEGLSNTLSSRLRYTTELVRELRKAMEEIHWLSITDGLTGLFNRRHFFELAEREVERAERYIRPLSAILLDIDHFKKINDTYGHAAGDEVLRGVAACCREEVRQADIVGRYGGEEFAILLPESGLETARQAAERLRKRIEGHCFQVKSRELHLTASLGVAEWQEGECAEVLVDRADQALYAAKEGGRNRVELIVTK